MSDDYYTMSRSKTAVQSSRLDRERICNIYADLTRFIDQVGTDPNLHFLETARCSLADAIFSLPPPISRSSVFTASASSTVLAPVYIEPASVPPTPVNDHPLPSPRTFKSDVPVLPLEERGVRLTERIGSMNIQNNRECHWVAGDFRIETAKPTRALSRA